MNARKQSERLINPLRFLFSYARSTICKEKIVGLWTAYNSGSGPKSSPPQRTLCRRGDDLEYPATVTASSEERGFLLEFELHLELMLNWSFNLFFFTVCCHLKILRGRKGLGGENSENKILQSVNLQSQGKAPWGRGWQSVLQPLVLYKLNFNDSVTCPLLLFLQKRIQRVQGNAVAGFVLNRFCSERDVLELGWLKYSIKHC